MRKFEANAELEKILLDKGFIETTSERDKIKEKKSFKYSKNARKEIYFDYINIRILPSGDSRIKMTEEELKCVFLYFELKAIDFKEIVYNGKFNFQEVYKGIESVKKEVELYEEIDGKLQRRKKLNRILGIYDRLDIK